MKITVICGVENKGVTYKLKDVFLENFKDAEVTEFYLPKDCPNFCLGCKTCFLRDEHLCKDAAYIQKLEEGMKNADLLVFLSPSYVCHTTGAMKAMLDHFGYRWMPHRPLKEMFGKRAVIITQCLGAGAKSAMKDIKDSLSWWGVSYIKSLSFKLFSDVDWNKIPKKRKDMFIYKLRRMAKKLNKIDYNKPAHTKLMVKMKFYMVRMLQRSLGKDDPEYTDFKYWNSNGWTNKTRPWK